MSGRIPERREAPTARSSGGRGLCVGGRRGAGPQPPDRAHRRRLEVGNRIREARLWRNLSQHALAERVGIDIKTLNRLEVGATDAGLHTVLGISDALDAPAACLMPGGPSPTAE